jgi:quinol monooxygenase YgiN
MRAHLPESSASQFVRNTRKKQEPPMPSVIATLQIKEDKIEEAKSALKGLAADTLANEPGTLAYTVHQQKDSPTTFVFYEKYESYEAFATHGENLKARGSAFAGILAGAPDIVVLDEI